MNKQELKSLIESCLSNSPKRGSDLAKAIEERWRQSKYAPSRGRHHLKCDALDVWIASCLRNCSAGKGDELENRVAEFLETLAEERKTEARAARDTTKIAAFRASERAPRSIACPFSDDEIRQQVREVLAGLGKNKT